MVTNFRQMFAARRVSGPALDFISQVAILSAQSRDAKEYGHSHLPVLQAKVEESTQAFVRRITNDQSVQSAMLQLVLAAELLGPRNDPEDLIPLDRLHPALAEIHSGSSLARNILMLKAAQRRAYEKHSASKLFITPDTDGEDCLCVQVVGQGGELRRLFKVHTPGMLLPEGFARTFLQAGLLVAAGISSSDLPNNLYFRGALQDWERLFNLFEGQCQVEIREVGLHMAHREVVERLDLTGAAALFVAREWFSQTKESSDSGRVEDEATTWEARMHESFRAGETDVGDLPGVKYRCYLLAEAAGATQRSGLGGGEALTVALRECHHPWFARLIDAAGEGEPDQQSFTRALSRVFSSLGGTLLVEPGDQFGVLDLRMDGASRKLTCLPGGTTLPGGFFLTFVQAGLIHAAGYIPDTDLPADGVVFAGGLEDWSRLYNQFQIMASRGDVG